MSQEDSDVFVYPKPSLPAAFNETVHTFNKLSRAPNAPESDQGSDTPLPLKASRGSCSGTFPDMPIHQNSRRTSAQLQRPAHFHVTRLRSDVGRLPSFSSVDSFRTDPDLLVRSESSRFGGLSRQSSSSNFNDLKWSEKDRPSSASSLVDADAIANSANALRWVPLPKISAKVFAHPIHQHGLESPQRLAPVPHLGPPTTLAANGMICIGTARGWIMVFDFSQSLKCVCGNEAISQESGGITALAVSSDRTFVAAGHATGAIHIYSLAKPSQAARTVQPTTLELVGAGRTEGHIKGSRIRHLAFVGTRHTAIVSSDDRGLAFYHSLGQVLGLANNDVVRIMGRYPDPDDEAPLPLPDSLPQLGMHDSTLLGEAPLADSTKINPKARHTVFCVATLPLAVHPHPTDSFSLVALITSTKLLIAGLKPSPKTWWRSSQKDGINKSPSEVGPVIGSLAWYPAIAEDDDPLLAFSWGSVIRVVAVKTAVAQNALAENGRATSGLISGKRQDVKRTLVVADRHAWQVEETVIKVAWLNQRILLAHTATHIDLWDTTTQLRAGRSPLDLRTVISPDSAYESFSPASNNASILSAYNVRVYKGKVFAVALADVRVATVLTWADRIIALVNTRNLIEAIELTSLYYQGQANASSMGLPTDDAARHEIVAPKLLEIMVASMEYAFSEKRMAEDAVEDGEGQGVDRTSLFEGLVDACTRACLVSDRLDFLFEDLYDRFCVTGIEAIFLHRIETFILSGQLRAVPPQLLQSLLASKDQSAHVQDAERIILNVDASAIDIDLTLNFCRRHHLYDALIYIYTEALADYSSPFIEMLALIDKVETAREDRAASDDSVIEISFETEAQAPDAYRLFLFLSAVFAGNGYPAQQALPSGMALLAKEAICRIAFSFKPVVPPSSQMAFEPHINTPYPYLTLLMRFDCEATLDWLDQAFEDSYLSDGVCSRQDIIDILLEITESRVSHLLQNDIVFLYMFVAHNLPKYPQYIRLEPAVLSRILSALVSDADLHTREDRQLSVEYLLSSWRPADMPRLYEELEQAGFYRILRMLYRSAQQWAKLAKAILQDADLAMDTFPQLEALLRVTKARKNQDVAFLVVDSVPALVDLAIEKTVQLVSEFLPTRHLDAVATLSDKPSRQLVYLRLLLAEPPAQLPEEALGKLQLHYLELLCEREPEDVISFLSTTHTTDAMLEICDRFQACDAAIWTLSRQGQPSAALDKFDSVMQMCIDELADQLLAKKSNAEERNIWLRRIRQATAISTQICTTSSLPLDEAWSRLLSSILHAADRVNQLNDASIRSALAKVTSQALDDLVSSASTESLSFAKVFRRLVADSETTHSFSALRSIVRSMNETYRIEEDMLRAAKDLYGVQVFDAFAELQSARETGWTVQSNSCEICKQPIWGAPTLPKEVIEEEQRHDAVDKLFKEHVSPLRPKIQRKPSLKGKEVHWPEEGVVSRFGRNEPEGPLVVFRSGLVMHQTCIQFQEDPGVDAMS